jgi:hypothetical protein
MGFSNTKLLLRKAYNVRMIEAPQSRLTPRPLLGSTSSRMRARREHQPCMPQCQSMRAATSRLQTRTAQDTSSTPTPLPPQGSLTARPTYRDPTAAHMRRELEIRRLQMIHVTPHLWSTGARTGPLANGAERIARLRSPKGASESRVPTARERALACSVLLDEDIIARRRAARQKQLELRHRLQEESARREARRRALSRRKQQREGGAACTIQSRFRGRKVRVAFAELRQAYVHRQREACENGSARIIQALLRGRMQRCATVQWKARMDALALRCIVRRLQRSWRVARGQRAHLQELLSQHVLFFAEMRQRFVLATFFVNARSL